MRALWHGSLTRDGQVVQGSVPQGAGQVGHPALHGHLREAPLALSARGRHATSSGSAPGHAKSTQPGHILSTCTAIALDVGRVEVEAAPPHPDVPHSLDVNCC